MRILAEDIAWDAFGVLKEFRDRECVASNQWKMYVNGVQAGAVNDVEYRRFLEAKSLFFRVFVDNSYSVGRNEPDEKSQRYAYSLSNEPMPEWFQLDKIIRWLEEIITACCFAWFSANDYYNEVA